MARTVSDIALFNNIFSSCNTTAVNVSLSGYRIGYPTNWWANLSSEVRGSCLSAHCHPPLLVAQSCHEAAPTSPRHASGCSVESSKSSSPFPYAREQALLPGPEYDSSCCRADAQVQDVFNRSLTAMQAAGVQLVQFDAQSMVDYQNKYIGDSTFYTYEMGREVSR